MRTALATFALAAIIALGSTASALAVTPSQAQYGNPAAALKPPTKPGGTDTVTNPAPPAATTTTAVGTPAGGTLPFTGLQLGLVVALGSILLLVGFGVRRAGRGGTA